MAQTSAAQEHHGVGRYLLIFGALIGLTVLTYLTATKLDLGPLNFPLAMLIATVKATMVVLWFMHLSEHKGTAAVVFVSSVFFVVLLIAVILSDVGTRWKWTNPAESVEHPGIEHPAGRRLHHDGHQPGSDKVPGTPH